MKHFLLIFSCLISYRIWSNPYPISFVNGLLVSEAVIEGKKVLVIFDTGSPGLVLNSRYYSADKTTGIPCTGLNGSFECYTHLVKNWTWMDVAHKKTNALLSDLSFLEHSLHKEVYALIGLSVLSDYYISMDFDRMLITLSEKMKTDGTPRIRFQYVGKLPVITCKVNGKKKILGLDTGSEINYLFSQNASCDENLFTHGFPVMVVGTENKADLKYSIPMALDLKDDHVYDSEFVIDLPHEGKFQNDSFDGFLGIAFLSRFNITIHPSKQIMFLSPRNSNEKLTEILTAQL